MASSYRMELDKWLSTLVVSADSVLDVGGSQQGVNKRVDYWDVVDYKVADLLWPHGGGSEPDIVMDLNRKHPFTEQFDIVFCLEVFEYVWNPDTAFKNLARACKPGGKVYATFPSQYPLHQPVNDDALRYMPAGIKKLAQNAELIVVDMIPRRFETDSFQRFWSMERMRAAKGEDHNFSGWICEFRK